LIPLICIKLLDFNLLNQRQVRILSYIYVRYGTLAHFFKILVPKGILLTTDVRFELEKEHIQRVHNGLVCRVHAPERTYQTQDSNLMNDISECSLDAMTDQDWDYVFQNDQPIYCLSEAEQRFKKFIELLEQRLTC
jgi:hypothetical protein